MNFFNNSFFILASLLSLQNGVQAKLCIDDKNFPSYMKVGSVYPITSLNNKHHAQVIGNIEIVDKCSFRFTDFMMVGAPNDVSILGEPVDANINYALVIVDDNVFVPNSEKKVSKSKIYNLTSLGRGTNTPGVSFSDITNFRLFALESKVPIGDAVIEGAPKPGQLSATGGSTTTTDPHGGHSHGKPNDVANANKPTATSANSNTQGNAAAVSVSSTKGAFMATVAFVGTLFLVF